MLLNPIYRFFSLLKKFDGFEVTLLSTNCCVGGTLKLSLLTSALIRYEYEIPLITPSNHFSILRYGTYFASAKL